jgi:4a-hydroxytetrahydrobiopterin dehydratase
METLHLENCISTRSNDHRLGLEEIQVLLLQIPSWQINYQGLEPHLEKVFNFKNFKQALDFTNRIGAIAETENHHPTLLTEWGRVTVYWWTHSVKGLHRNDFIMAAKTDHIFIESD